MDISAKKFDMSTICRCCRVIDGVRILLTSYFNTKDKSYKVDEMYAYCINSQVIIEGHPKYICVNCLQQLIATYDFRKKCMESNTWFQKNGQKTFQIKHLTAKHALVDHDYTKIFDPKIICTTGPIHDDPKNNNLESTITKQNVLENHSENENLNDPTNRNDLDFWEEPIDEEKALEDQRAEMILASILQDAENGIMNFDSPKKIKEPIFDQEKPQIISLTQSKENQIKKKLELSSCEALKTIVSPPTEIKEKSYLGALKNIKPEPERKIGKNKPVSIILKKENFPNKPGGKIKIRIKQGNVNEETLHNIVNRYKQGLLKVVPKDRAANVATKIPEKVEVITNILEDMPSRQLIAEKYGAKDLNGYYTCKICNKKLKDIRHHMHSHNGVKRYKCKICGREFLRNTNFKNHMLSHAGIKNFGCDICQKKFVTKDILRVHKHVHQEKKHLCSYCGKGFSLKGTLINHLRRHTGEKPLQCNYCDKRFADPNSLSVHHKSHTGEKPHLCHYCGKSFATACQLKGHIRIHTEEKPYPCTYCERKFRTNGLRLIHTRAAHTGERPFSCDICNKSFYSKGKLRDHRKTHNKDQQYPCNHCDLYFRTKGALKNHLSNAYKKYECENCDNKFAKKKELKEHIQSVHPELVQENTKCTCRVCNIEFENMAILNEHKKMHEPDNYICKYCYKTFSSASGLSRHVSRIHSEETDYRNSDSSAEGNVSDDNSDSNSS